MIKRIKLTFEGTEKHVLNQMKKWVANREKLKGPGSLFRKPNPHPCRHCKKTGFRALKSHEAFCPRNPNSRNYWHKIKRLEQSVNHLPSSTDDYADFPSTASLLHDMLNNDEESK